MIHGDSPSVSSQCIPLAVKLNKSMNIQSKAVMTSRRKFYDVKNKCRYNREQQCYG